MGHAIPVRTDYTAGQVRRIAQRAKDAAQARRLLAIAAVLDGASREEAAKIGGMDRQTLRDWVIRFNEQGPDGLINIPSPGVPPKLNALHKAFLAQIVEEGPIPGIHRVVRWRACDLIMRLHEQFGLSVSDDTIYRALKKLGFSHMSARPKAYKQNAEAMEAFKKTSPSVWRKSAAALTPGTPLEVWFQRRDSGWVKRTSLPIARPEKARIPGPSTINAPNQPICSVRSAPNVEPAPPSCCRPATVKPCSSISTRSQPKSPPGAHAILLLDQAGWHGAKALVVPSNVSLLPLPPRAAPRLRRRRAGGVGGSGRSETLLGGDQGLWRRASRPDQGGEWRVLQGATWVAISSRWS